MDATGTAPLHWAAFSGDRDIVRYLLCAKADYTVCDEDGSALDACVRKNHSDCAIVLRAAAILHEGGTLPAITLSVENRTPVAVTLCQLGPDEIVERQLETLPPAASATSPSVKVGLSHPGFTMSLRDAASGALLSTHFVVDQPPQQQLICGSAPPSKRWEWEDGPRGSGMWIKYDSAMEAAIAAAEAEGRPRFTATIHGGTYTIDLQQLSQKNERTQFIRRLRVRQLDEGERSRLEAAESLPLASDLFRAGATDGPLRAFPGGFDQAPPYWGEGSEVAGETGGVGTRMRALDATSSAIYQEILGMIMGSGQSLSTLRMGDLFLVENAARFDQYAAAKRAMERRLGASNVGERWLWHGTAKDKIPMILANGFLRDFNQRGAYGRGVYFASSASYSLSSMYASPEEGSGDQYILLVRVLIGEACHGRSSMERPSQKPGSVELYDSMVDSISSPKIYVLSAGSDNRAYPEFVLRVRRAGTRS